MVSLDDVQLFHAVEDPFDNSSSSSDDHSQPVRQEEFSYSKGANGTADTFVFSEKNIQGMIATKKNYRMKQLQERFTSPTLFLILTLIAFFLIAGCIEVCLSAKQWCAIVWLFAILIQIYNCVSYPCAIRKSKIYTDKNIHWLVFRNRFLPLLGNIFLCLPIYYFNQVPHVKEYFFGDIGVCFMYFNFFIIPWIVYIARFHYSSRTKTLLHMVDSVQLLHPEDIELREEEQKLDKQIKAAKERLREQGVYAFQNTRQVERHKKELSRLEDLEQQRIECIAKRYLSYKVAE